MNATLNSAVSSPLESPDIMQAFVPLNDISAATTSMASIKLSADSINNKSQQVRHIRLASFSNSTSTSNHNSASSASIPHDTYMAGAYGGGGDIMNSKSSSLRTIFELPTYNTTITTLTNTNRYTNDDRSVRFAREYHQQSGYQLGKPLVEFSLSSVGRSFIDETEENDDLLTNASLKTPDTPTPNISPSSSNRFSETFSNDFLKPQSPSAAVSPISDGRPLYPVSGENYAGSWDLLELDMDFHDVNFDPSFGGDVEEREFLGDSEDPLGILPCRPTPPDTLDL